MNHSWTTHEPLRNHSETTQKPLVKHIQNDSGYSRTTHVYMIKSTLDRVSGFCSNLQVLPMVPVWFLSGFWVAHGRLHKMCREGVFRPTWYGNSPMIESLSFQDAHDEASARREILHSLLCQARFEPGSLSRWLQIMSRDDGHTTNKNRDVVSWPLVPKE